MAYSTKLSIINGVAFVVLISALNIFTDLTNNAKIVLGLSLIFLDFAHKLNPRVAILAMLSGCMSIYFFSDPEFAASAALASLFTFPLEMCIFYWWYYVKKRAFAVSLLLSNAVPSILDGVVWSFILGSFTAQWASVTPYIVACCAVISFASAGLPFERIRYRVLLILPIMLGIALVRYHTDAWIDPAAEAWSNWFLQSIHGFLNLIGLGDSDIVPVVSLNNSQDRFFISVVDWIVSACYMLAPVAFFAAIYVRVSKKERMR